MENNLTPEQTQAGLDSISIGEGPSWGGTYKVKPYAKTEAAAGFGPGYYYDAGSDNSQFSINRGETMAIGMRASGQIGVQFGPYFSNIGSTDRNSSLSFGLGLWGGEVNYGKDGIGLSIGAGPSWGWSGISKGELDMNASSGKEVYHYDY
ncbi:polymorphic toxin type 25 domain-containing protein [Buttiauxella izardii]|uniref:polymorphic toxin type 25 domain-containing protein n=1 Tax=Buttiauxella izardii TaxID=82991 RepID=UPI00142DA29E|nr:polymorphic toxin type 25 domain-containing protein [Buttiauxella izardii]